MSIVTCTAKTRNDLSVARIVIEVLAQSWGYKCSVTYNEGKSFDIMVPTGAEENAILKFKRLAPDLDIYKSDKKAMATAQTESRKRMQKREERDYFDSQVVKMSWGELPDDVQSFIGSSSDWESADIDTRYEWIADGIERNHITSVDFDTMNDYWYDKTEESRKTRRKSESRRCMKKEGSETEEEFIQKYRNKSFVELPYNLRMYMKEGGFTINDWDIPEDPQFRSTMLGDAWTDGIRD